MDSLTVTCVIKPESRARIYWTKVSINTLVSDDRVDAYPLWSWANGIEVDESGWRIDSDSRELAEKEVDFCRTLIALVNG
jgi:hypothetical protein